MQRTRLPGQIIVVASLAISSCGCGSTPEPAPAHPASVPPGPAGEPVVVQDPTSGEGPRETALELTATELAERLEAEGQVTLRTIAFRAGSDELLPEAHPILGQVVVVMREQPDLRLRIQVHSDAQGDDGANQRMTDRRALAIKDWLQGQGVDAGRLEAAGYGEQHPIAPNGTPEGRRANRRVELVVVP